MLVPIPLEVIVARIARIWLEYPKYETLPFSNFDAKNLSKIVVDLKNKPAKSRGKEIFNIFIKCRLNIDHVNENLYFFKIGDSKKQEKTEPIRYPIANALIPKLFFNNKKNEILITVEKIGVIEVRENLFSIWYKLLKIFEITLLIIVGTIINKILFTNIFSSIV